MSISTKKELFVIALATFLLATLALVATPTSAYACEDGTCGEDTSLTATTTDGTDGLVPVYCLYNRITSEHLFTTDKTEYNNWAEKYYFYMYNTSKKDYWEPEGIAWYANTSGTFVYRLYNPNLGAIGHTSHYYTSDTTEIKELTSKHGWVQEDQSKGFYAGGDVAVYTCYNELLGSAHHYTTDKTEYSGLSKHGWNLENDKNGTVGVFKVAKAGTKCTSSKDVFSTTGTSVSHDWKKSSLEKNGQTYAVWQCQTCGVISYTAYVPATTKYQHNWQSYSEKTLVKDSYTYQREVTRIEEQMWCNNCGYTMKGNTDEDYADFNKHMDYELLSGAKYGWSSGGRAVFDHYETITVPAQYSYKSGQKCTKCKATTDTSTSTSADFLKPQVTYGCTS